MDIKCVSHNNRPRCDSETIRPATTTRGSDGDDVRQNRGVKEKVTYPTVCSDQALCKGVSRLARISNSS